MCCGKQGLVQAHVCAPVFPRNVYLKTLIPTRFSRGVLGQTTVARGLDKISPWVERCCECCCCSEPNIACISQGCVAQQGAPAVPSLVARVKCQMSADSTRCSCSVWWQSAGSFKKILLKKKSFILPNRGFGFDISIGIPILRWLQYIAWLAHHLKSAIAKLS